MIGFLELFTFNYSNDYIKFGSFTSNILTTFELNTPEAAMWYNLNLRSCSIHEHSIVCLISHLTLKSLFVFTKGPGYMFKKLRNYKTIEIKNPTITIYQQSFKDVIFCWVFCTCNAVSVPTQIFDFNHTSVSHTLGLFSLLDLIVHAVCLYYFERIISLYGNGCRAQATLCNGFLMMACNVFANFDNIIIHSSEQSISPLFII